MQTQKLNNAQELASFLEKCDVLDIADHGAIRTIAVECEGQDVLVFADSKGKATVVYPFASFN